MSWWLVAGSVVQGYARYERQKQLNAQARHRAAIAKANAKTAREEADYAINAAAFEESRFREKIGQFKSEQRAAMGASGFAVGSESFQQVLEDTAAQAEIDAMLLRQKGKISAWRHRERARQYEEEAKLTEYDIVDPRLAAAPSLLGAAGQASDATR